MTRIIDFLFKIKAVSVYKDGDTFGFVWHWWHPLSYVICPTFFVMSIFVEGWDDTMKYKHELGIGMKPFFKENPDKLEWI